VHGPSLAELLISLATWRGILGVASAAIIVRGPIRVGIIVASVAIVAICRSRYQRQVRESESAIGGILWYDKEDDARVGIVVSAASAIGDARAVVVALNAGGARSVRLTRNSQG